jgi:hypothetical protein
MTNMWEDAFWESLIGKEIVAIDVSRGEQALRFRCADGTAVVWDTEGDCCSESWWADGYSLSALRGATVRTASEIELPDYNVEDGRTRQEFDAAYGVRIETEKGGARFAFRNSSNGYYGGWAMLGTDGDGWEWREIPGNEWSA